MRQRLSSTLQYNIGKWKFLVKEHTQGHWIENYLEKNITGGDSCQTNQEFSLNQARIVNHDFEDDLENT